MIMPARNIVSAVSWAELCALFISFCAGKTIAVWFLSFIHLPYTSFMPTVCSGLCLLDVTYVICLRHFKDNKH